MDEQVYGFGPYRLVPGARALWRESDLVSLTGREFDTLVALVRRAGVPVDREILLKEIWPDRLVEENNLAQQIRSLRKKLGKDSDGLDYIRTIPNQGYFMAGVIARTIPTCEEPNPPSTEPERPNPKSVEIREKSSLTLRVSSGRLIALTGGVVAVLGAWMILTHAEWKPNAASASPKPVARGRFFWRAAAEAGHLTSVPLPHEPTALDISPDGKRVYILPRQTPALMVVNTDSLTVHEVSINQHARSVRVSPDGRQIYLGLYDHGILVLNVASERVEETILTEGPVNDIAIAPDGSKLYAAMLHHGVWRLTLGARAWKRLTFQGCPYFIALDPTGTRLAVSYQCGGPAGRNGHDTVEVMDTGVEDVSLTFTGPPLVGGEHQFSPDGKLIWLDGLDACVTSTYDRIGCPVVPSAIQHVIRLADKALIRSLSLPLAVSGHPKFHPDGSRVFMSGHIASVLSVSSFEMLETYDLKQDYASGTAISADGSRAYVTRTNAHDLLVFSAEDNPCSLNNTRPTHYMTGDGTSEDSIESPYLAPSPEFRPGFLGQAFLIDGDRKTSIQWASDLQFGITPWSLAFYIKASSSSGPLLHWFNPEQKTGWSLDLKENKLHFSQQSRGQITEVVNDVRLEPDHWTYVAITEDSKDIKMFVNGIPAGQAAYPGPFVGYLRNIDIGWSSEAPAVWKGLIDELAFWERALPAQEIGEIYQRSTVPACRP